MLTPLKFRAVYKDYLWGGERLKDYGKVDPAGKRVAESWEVAHHPNGESIVREGEYEGKSLGELLEAYGRDLVGSLAREQDLKKFPLLIKLIGAQQNLSVQVHPNDEQAKRLRPGEYGKNEMWVIVKPPSTGSLIAGVKPEVTREEFTQSVADGTLEENLRYVPVKEGEALNIPAGLIHAITAGAVIYEVQQNSDTTFRVYDYNRRGDDGKLRELHVDEALEVSRFGEDIDSVFAGLKISDDETLLVHNRYFDVRSLKIQDTLERSTKGRSFHVLTNLEGTLSLHFDGGETMLTAGETCLIPASLGTYRLSSEDGASAILSQLPDPEALDEAKALAKEQGLALETCVGLEPEA